MPPTSSVTTDSGAPGVVSSGFGAAHPSLSRACAADPAASVVEPAAETFGIDDGAAASADVVVVVVCRRLAHHLRRTGGARREDGARESRDGERNGRPDADAAVCQRTPRSGHLSRARASPA
ncbi:MAG: hypothetical protein V9E99_16755 [Microthrixaceae bacterium]